MSCVRVVKGSDPKSGCPASGSEPNKDGQSKVKLVLSPSKKNLSLKDGDQ